MSSPNIGNMGIHDLLAGMHRPERFAEIAALHTNAFAWRRQNRIPLGIHVVDPGHFKHLTYRDWLNPEPLLEYQAKVLADTLAVGSDVLPVVAINHLGDAVLPSMFGAELHMPDSCSATLQDIGPTPIPKFSSIDEAAACEMPSMDAGIMPAVGKLAQYYRQALPEWVHVVAPMPAGPFSTAMELRGSNIMLDMIEHPDLVHRFVETCARLLSGVERHVRHLIHSPLDRHVSNFGIFGTGLRLGEDSMVNLSPAMIREFCLPAFATVNELCGGCGHVHFCSLPHSRFEHIYPTLAGVSEVAVLSSQFGFEYYQTHLAELQGRLAIESFYGDAYSYVCDKHRSFRDWANGFVPRFKHESGLVLYCQVASVEQGKELWNTWQEAHSTS
jgi:hypothetical protein